MQSHAQTFCQKSRSEVGGRGVVESAWKGKCSRWRRKKGQFRQKWRNIRDLVVVTIAANGCFRNNSHFQDRWPPINFRSTFVKTSQSNSSWGYKVEGNFEWAKKVKVMHWHFGTSMDTRFTNFPSKFKFICEVIPNQPGNRHLMVMNSSSNCDGFEGAAATTYFISPAPPQ